MSTTSDGGESARRQFGPAAAAYAASRYHAEGPDLAALVEAAELTGTERALDLGCGAGHTALALAPLVREVVACDVTEAMLEQAEALARERGAANVSVLAADAASLPLDEGSFDVVACRVAAHHFHDVRGAVGEMARVLAPGGRLLIIDSYTPAEPPETDAIFDRIERLRDASHVRDYLLDEWEAVLAEVGLAARFLEFWEMRMEFEDWTGRMHTPPASVAALKQTMDAAPPDVRARLGIVDGAYDLNIPLVLLRAGWG